MEENRYFVIVMPNADIDDIEFIMVGSKNDMTILSDGRGIIKLPIEYSTGELATQTPDVLQGDTEYSKEGITNLINDIGL